MSSRIASMILASLSLFGTLSAAIGATLGVFANGAGVSLDYLAGSPFSSYCVPGLILGTVVGGTQLSAALAIFARRHSAMLFSAIAGFGMIIWVFAELAIVLHYSWLQSVYFSLGVLELVLVFALLGIMPKFVVPIRNFSTTPASV